MSSPPVPGSHQVSRGSRTPLPRSAASTSLFPAACRTLPAELTDAYSILRDYADALRTIADHPALDARRKEARLKAVADAIEGSAGLDAEDAAVRAALNLRHLLESRGLDIRDPWQMLQAAGQDIHKTAYPDWSDLFAWSRFWAGPMGRMAFSLAGGDRQALSRAETFAIAVQLLHIVEQAPTQHRWLGRVYLPARWFREAGSDASELAGAAATEELRQVFDRTLDEAEKLMSASLGLGRHLPTRRLRIAEATARGEARAWARALRKSDPLKGPKRLNRSTRLAVTLLGIVRGLVL